MRDHHDSFAAQLRPRQFQRVSLRYCRTTQSDAAGRLLNVCRDIACRSLARRCAVR